jgi:hypothetical protein
LDRVNEAVKSVGKSWGILARGAEHAAKCRELGCQLFAFATDLGVAFGGGHEASLCSHAARGGDSSLLETLRGRIHSIKSWFGR